jgi:thioredoxin 2
MENTAQHMVRCVKCGANNRIVHEKKHALAKCGKCGALLETASAGASGGESVLFRCMACGTRNRIPSGKIDAGVKCGKCGAALETEELFVAQPLMVTEKNFDEKVLRSPLPAIVFAWAPWCPTCRSAMPVIDEYAKDAKGKIRVAKLNVDTSQALASKYHILSVPQIMVFDNGRLNETLPGTLQKHELMMKMARYL